MKIEIKQRYTEDVLYTCDAENLKDAVIEAVSKDADLRDADLGGANLNGANLNGAYLRGADLRDADLGGADLRGADLNGADLHGADLGGANLRGADLRDADLRDADLRDAYLRGADLRDADLCGAYLRGAYLRGADLYGKKIVIAPISILNLTWDILISESYLVIGCQRHTHDEWKAFTKDEIKKMESRASNFWTANKSWLLSACKAHRKESLKFRKALGVNEIDEQLGETK